MPVFLLTIAGYARIMVLMLKNGLNITAKYNRCLAFTLPSGKVIEVKVLGEKPQAAADAKELFVALTVSA